MSHDTTGDDKKIFTPFNVIAGIIILVGLVLTFLRFTKGIGAVTNLDDNNPWGLWIGFDLLCGVALAAGGYVTSAACYIFGLKRYHSAVRPAILTAFRRNTRRKFRRTDCFRSANRTPPTLTRRCVTYPPL